MPRTLDPELRRALAARIRYYNEMGIYDFYRQPLSERAEESAAPISADEKEILVSATSVSASTVSTTQPESGEEMSPRRAAAAAMPVAIDDENIFDAIAPKPEQSVSDPVKALKIIREDLGDCTRCVLHKQGRKQIVFGVGNPKAELMFVGEGPGADEDEKGEPFVGRAGQLLNNMIKAMGIAREQVYIANIVKCRPPGNRHAGARRVRDLFAVSDAADCGRQAEGDRGARGSRGENAAGDECFDDATARPVLRLQAGRNSY